MDYHNIYQSTTHVLKNAFKPLLHYTGIIVFGASLTYSTFSYADPCIAGANPLLSVADFSGDGLVDSTDISQLTEVINSGEYIAYFDRNVDGIMSQADLDNAQLDVGQNSTPLDQEIAEVYWATRQYRNLAQAALAGYVPSTQYVPGHGIHWANITLFSMATYPTEPIRSLPAGLNYTSTGELRALFWNQIAATDTLGTITSPEPASLFSAQYTTETIHWHSHTRTCTTNMGFLQYVFFEEEVPIEQCLAREALSDGMASSFYMQHLWLYYLNPNGAFAMTHPCA